MTTENTIPASASQAPASQAPARFRLPDPPPREPDEMTAYDHVYKNASHRYLAIHFGNPDTTLVEYDRWIIASPQDNRARARRPDLLIAFGVSPQDYAASNGYIISEQGKPPDFVLEVASESTAENDTGPKRDDYAALGIPEYWRFDETGEDHGAKLAGDRLVEGRYEPILITETDDGALQGYSAVLNLLIRWDRGQLGWRDPETNGEVPTFEQERETRIRAEHRADTAEHRADTAEHRADTAEHRADTAEARVRELEAELERRNRGGEQPPPATDASPLARRGDGWGRGPDDDPPPGRGQGPGAGYRPWPRPLRRYPA